MPLSFSYLSLFVISFTIGEKGKDKEERKAIPMDSATAGQCPLGHCPLRRMTGKGKGKNKQQRQKEKDKAF
jgi:hypothetical protein